MGNILRENIDGVVPIIIENLISDSNNKEFLMQDNENNRKNVKENNQYIYEIIDEVINDNETMINLIIDLNKIFKKDTNIKQYLIKTRQVGSIINVNNKTSYLCSISLAWIDSLNQLNLYTVLKEIFIRS